MENIAANVFSRAGRRGRVAVGLSPTDMTDSGMYVWGGIVAVVGLAASYGIAVWWQRWREKSRG